MITDLQAMQWEVAAAIVLTTFAVGLAFWWALLEWWDRRTARRLARPAARHSRHAMGQRTQHIDPGRYRRPDSLADVDKQS